MKPASILVTEAFRPCDEAVTIELRDAHRGTDRRGQTILDYTLIWHRKDGSYTVFNGSDFCGSPLHADDSADTLCALLGFLTLRRGDTDADYFQDYTPLQLEWAESYCCEALGAEYSAIAEGDQALPSVERACALANIEIFERTASEVADYWNANGGADTGDENPWGDAEGPLDGGWYYWSCLPGCLPDLDPSGPYETRREAVEAAYDDLGLYED